MEIGLGWRGPLGPCSLVLNRIRVSPPPPSQHLKAAKPVVSAVYVSYVLPTQTRNLGLSSCYWRPTRKTRSFQDGNRAGLEGSARPLLFGS